MTRKGAYVAAKVTATGMSFMLQHHEWLSLEAWKVEGSGCWDRCARLGLGKESSTGDSCGELCVRTLI